MTSRKENYSPEAWERHKQRATQYHRDNPAAHKATTDRYIRERREWLDAFKRQHGCANCGTREGRLDFDHRPGTVKRLNLGRPRASWATIHAELAKCDVRCVACHAKRHGIARGGLNHAASSLGMSAVPKLSSP